MRTQNPCPHQPAMTSIPGPGRDVSPPYSRRCCDAAASRILSSVWRTPVSVYVVISPLHQAWQNISAKLGGHDATMHEREDAQASHTSFAELSRTRWHEPEKIELDNHHQVGFWCPCMYIHDGATWIYSTRWSIEYSVT